MIKILLLFVSHKEHKENTGNYVTYLYEIFFYNSGTLEQTLANIAAFIEANPDNKAFGVSVILLR